MLSQKEKILIGNIVANYSEKLLISAIDGDSEETIHSHMTDFYNLFVSALTVAKREGRMSALTTFTN